MSACDSSSDATSSFVFQIDRIPLTLCVRMRNSLKLHQSKFGASRSIHCVIPSLAFHSGAVGSISVSFAAWIAIVHVLCDIPGILTFLSVSSCHLCMTSITRLSFPSSIFCVLNSVTTCNMTSSTVAPCRRSMESKAVLTADSTLWAPSEWTIMDMSVATMFTMGTWIFVWSAIRVMR